MANQLENSDLIIQLPWTVPQQENTQAVILQQPNDQKLIIKIEQDLDWITTSSILLSFLAFIVTIYVVRKSTHQNIEINKSLINAQLDLKIRELIIQSENHKVDKLRDCASVYFATGMKLNNECITAIDEVYHLQNRENSLEKIKQLIKSNYYDFSAQAHTVFVYLDISNDIDQIIKNEIFELQKKAWEFYSIIGIDYDESLVLLDELARQFGYTQKLLIEYIKKLEINIYKKD